MTGRPLGDNVKAFYTPSDGRTSYHAGYWSSDGLFYLSAFGRWRDTPEAAQADWDRVVRIANGTEQVF